jgi:hypothetical protein
MPRRCSGDGTLRKNGATFRKGVAKGGWSALSGLGRHALQLAILRQGLARLRIGGRLVCQLAFWGGGRFRLRPLACPGADYECRPSRNTAID